MGENELSRSSLFWGKRWPFIGPHEIEPLQETYPGVSGLARSLWTKDGPESPAWPGTSTSLRALCGHTPDRASEANAKAAALCPSPGIVRPKSPDTLSPESPVFSHRSLRSWDPGVSGLFPTTTSSCNLSFHHCR